MKRLAQFLTCEDGAVTADWVVLTAVIVGFGAIITFNFTEPLRHVDTETGNALSSVTVADPSFNTGGN